MFDDLSRLGFDARLKLGSSPPRNNFRKPAWTLPKYRPPHRPAGCRTGPAGQYESVSDPLRWFGLPQSPVREYGDGLLRSIRLQRAVLQLWTEDVPWPAPAR